MTAVNLNRAVRGPVTAVPIVAGKGVRLVADTQNNRWVVEADETVLWNDTTPPALGDTITLSEVITNFEKIEFHWASGNYQMIDSINTTGMYGELALDLIHGAGVNNVWVQVLNLTVNITNKTIAFSRARNFNFGSFTSTTWSNPASTIVLGDSYKLLYIKGINRIASN